jgi:signal transduction histidine kinase/streptogramin lyase
MPVSSLTAVLCDREGTLWLGSEGAGLLRWNGYGEWEAYTEAEGLAGDRITELLPAPGGGYWAGTDGGLNIGRPEKGRWVWKLVPIPGLSMVRDLELGPDGALWISSPAPYIIRYVPSTGRIDRIAAPAPEVLGLAFDSTGALWAASTTGIFRSLAPGPGARFERCEPEKPGARFSANEVETGADGAVWVSTYQGLLRFDGRQWRVFNEASGLRSTLIANLTRAPDGGIWLTYFDPQGISLVRFEGGRLLVQHFDHRNGLPGDQVDFVAVDSAGRVWAATNRGAAVREGNEWLILNRESGLIWDETATISVFPDGHSVWIGTARGLSLFTPRAALKPQSPPGIVITGVVAGGEEIRTAPDVAIARTQADSLLFRFSALSHRRPVSYQYRLIGFDTGWRDASGNEAAYSFLPRRRYRFEVRARSPGTQWSAQPASFEVDVKPPVPLSVWLSILAAVLIGIGGRYYWRRRLRRVEVERQLLECRVAERTVELSTANQQLRREIVEREKSAREKLALEEQLRHSQKMEALGRLAGGVAHDFNNLLTVINGYSQLALRKVEPEHPVHRQISEILDAGQRATDLTRQLLAFSRKQTVERKPVELNRTVAELRNLLARLVDNRVELVVTPSGGDVTVLADPGQLQQVLMNLAVNARDAMPGGGVIEIETGMEPDPENGRMMGRLTVRDSGVGMTEEVRQRIFEPFFTTKESGRGTGLGLAMVYGIVQQHGGVIRVTSQPGNGSCFDILLPLAETPAPDARRPVERRIVGGSEVILLVEDQREIRALAAASLRSLGYEVIEAAGSGDAGKACAEREGRIHLLLSDIVMPGISGYELAARLTAAYPHIRVLLKPYTPESLALKVREVLDHPPPPTVPAPAADPRLDGNAGALEAGPRAAT